jgi:hypothetical protein
LKEDLNGRRLIAKIRNRSALVRFSSLLKVLGVQPQTKKENLSIKRKQKDTSVQPSNSLQIGPKTLSNDVEIAELTSQVATLLATSSQISVTNSSSNSLKHLNWLYKILQVGHEYLRPMNSQVICLQTTS